MDGSPKMGVKSVPHAPSWVYVLRSDTFWIVGAFIAINFFYTRTKVKQAKSKSNTEREKPATNPTGSTTTTPDPSTERLDEERILGFRFFRCLYIILSSLLIPVQLLEGYWAYHVVYSLIWEVWDVTTFWKPYVLSVAVVLFKCVFTAASITLFPFVTAYILVRQIEFINMLIELPIPKFTLKKDDNPQPQRQEDENPQPQSQEDDNPQPQSQEDDNPQPQSQEDDNPQPQSQEDNNPQPQSQEDNNPQPQSQKDDNPQIANDWFLWGDDAQELNTEMLDEIRLI